MTDPEWISGEGMVEGEMLTLHAGEHAMIGSVSVDLNDLIQRLDVTQALDIVARLKKILE